MNPFGFLGGIGAQLLTGLGLVVAMFVGFFGVKASGRKQAVTERRVEDLEGDKAAEQQRAKEDAAARAAGAGPDARSELRRQWGGRD